MSVATLEALCDDRRALECFGGKALQLGRALHAGLPVPDGLALSVDLVEQIARGERSGGAQLDLARRRLPGGALAVRSSAVDEDSDNASFAGQHLTRLNVAPDDLPEAIGAIWESGRSPGALAYRRRLGLESTPRVAVVLQELVDADRAGVMFTCDPVTGADQIVIEASWGLGESVVSGLVDPDRFRLTPTGEVLERTPGQKDVAVVRQPGGGTAEQEVDSSRHQRLCLDDRDLSRLLQLARRCDQVFGGPHDIEWALSGDELYLLQRRGVTR